MTDHDHHDPHVDGSSPHVAHGVPGGSTRLPRLSSPHGRRGPGGGPAVEVVEGGFIDDELTRARRSREQREQRCDPDDEPTVLRFSDYSPTESLFVPTAGEDTPVDPDAPTSILGVAPDADWNTIRAAHRKLLAQLHPDRFVTADEPTRTEASERLARINIAYPELERTRRAV